MYYSSVALNINEFYDINTFPLDEGILLMGISMNRIGNTQSAAACYGYLQHLDTKIVKTNGIGMVVWYGDYLYFHSDQPASLLRDRYKNLMLQHKNGFLNLLTKNPAWIKKAFSFSTFGQIMLDNAEIFSSAWTKLTEYYEQDEGFRAAVEADVARAGHGLGERERLFILEEILTFYLAAKGQLRYNNQFVAGTERWVLPVYPGKPLMSEVYLQQRNPFRLDNPANVYEHCYYDLSGQVLYDYSRLDLATFDFS